jgi:4-diphosphocytidyl-2-C-methyl-D-erythritol kinase
MGQYAATLAPKRPRAVLSFFDGIRRLGAMVWQAERRVAILAPAKVNLVLRIVGRRADGYHLLESLMVPISLCDELEIRAAAVGGPRSSVSCRVSGPAKIPGGPTNLASRAARRVMDELGVSALVGIHLRKRIPAGAGLGGGSSDAAAVLTVLPGLLGRRLSRRRLRMIAAELGADVAFFLDCRPAWATGIGEILEPIPSFPRLDLVVVVPRRRVATAWAYANALPRLGELTTRKRGRSRARGLRAGAKSLSFRVSNDFEHGVSAAVPDVARLRRRLEALGASAVVMSGSGSAVVGIFASRAEAEQAAGMFRSPDMAAAVQVLRRRPAERG